MNIKVRTYSRYRRRRRRRILATVLIVLGLCALAVLIAIPPLVLGPMINGHVDFTTITSAEAYGLVADKVTLRTMDGIDIVAYDVYREDPKAVIVFISGIHNPSVTAFFGHARMLWEHGYASVLYEMRAHGESEGDVVALGFEEWKDTQAVVEYIQSQEKYADVPIVVFGMSMGGAVAINSIGKIQDIDGVIALSAYSSFTDVFADQMINMGAGEILAWLERPFVTAYLMFKYGVVSLEMTPAKQIENLGGRPALIVHSTQDSQVPYASFERLVARAPEHVETWVRSGDHHMIAHDFTEPRNDPEYAERILSFLERHFGV